MIVNRVVRLAPCGQPFGFGQQAWGAACCCCKHAGDARAARWTLDGPWARDMPNPGPGTSTPRARHMGARSGRLRLPGCLSAAIRCPPLLLALLCLQAADMVMHPSPGHYSGTLVNALLHHCQLPAMQLRSDSAPPLSLEAAAAAAAAGRGGASADGSSSGTGGSRSNTSSSQGQLQHSDTGTPATAGGPPPLAQHPAVSDPAAGRGTSSDSQGGRLSSAGLEAEDEDDEEAAGFTLVPSGGGGTGSNGTIRPGIVHRLDKGTTGLLVVAKTDAAHLGLAQQASCWRAPAAAAALPVAGLLPPLKGGGGGAASCGGGHALFGAQGQSAGRMQFAVSVRAPGRRATLSMPLRQEQCGPAYCSCVWCTPHTSTHPSCAVQGPHGQPHVRVHRPGGAPPARGARGHERGQVRVPAGWAPLGGRPWWRHRHKWLSRAPCAGPAHASTVCRDQVPTRQQVCPCFCVPAIGALATTVSRRLISECAACCARLYAHSCFVPVHSSRPSHQLPLPLQGPARPQKDGSLCVRLDARPHRCQQLQAARGAGRRRRVAGAVAAGNGAHPSGACSSRQLRSAGRRAGTGRRQMGWA